VIAALAAIVVHLAAAGAYRDINPLSFDGWHGDLRDALDIFLTNGRIVIGLAVGAAFVGWVAALPPIDQIDGNPATMRFGRRMIVISCDAVVGALVTINVALVGGAIGAYGWRVIAHLVPHALVEVPAFIVALTLYVRAHRGRLSLNAGALGYAAALLLLAIAAPLEAFIS